MSNHVQHVIKIFQALPLVIFYSVKGRGEPGSRGYVQPTWTRASQLALMCFCDMMQCVPLCSHLMMNHTKCIVHPPHQRPRAHCIVGLSQTCTHEPMTIRNQWNRSQATSFPPHHPPYTMCHPLWKTCSLVTPSQRLHILVPSFIPPLEGEYCSELMTLYT